MQQHPLNEEVKFQGVATVVDYKEKPLGKVDMEKMKELRREKGLDVLLLNPNPPIIQLLNYWRVLYKAGAHIRDSLQRREHQSAKTITINSKILKHDLSVKLTKIQSLLDKGSQVIVEVTAKDYGNKDHLVQARQIAKSVKEHFNKLDKCEIDVENTDKGANVSLELPLEDQQNQELDSFLDNKEVIQKAGYGPRPETPRKEPKPLPLYEVIDRREGKKPVEEEKKQEEKDSLEKLERREEAQKEYMEFLRKKEHEKKAKRREERDPNIHKSHAKFN